MSENALKDLNTIHISERKRESSSEGSITISLNEDISENLEEWQKKRSVSLVSTHANGGKVLNDGNEAASLEIEYTDSENLNDLEDVDSRLKTLLTGLDSKDWILVCEALNTVRSISIFHKEAMLDMLGDVISLVVKSMKNPRSAVCKTAIMTSADIFSAYTDLIIESLDPLLVQLLLKSSQDKRFVCEAAERALVTMTTWVNPVLLLPKLQSYLKNRNPRIRAKASLCFCQSVLQLGSEGIKSFGIDKLIQTAATQLSDQLPESREAARSLLMELQNVYQNFHDLSPMALSENPGMDSWENFCQSTLSPLSAQAVLRVTNISRVALVMGS